MPSVPGYRQILMLDGRAGTVKPARPIVLCYTPTRKVISMSSNGIADGLTAAMLETKWKSNFQWQKRNPFNNRIRRALSWLTRAERERERYDLDAAFISLLDCFQRGLCRR